MRIVVADTGPLNYLLLIGAIDLLPKLFEAVLIPEIVCAELRRPGASSLVRIWADQLPAWVDIQVTPPLAMPDLVLRRLDDGEAAAIVLARHVHADLILMDDRAGVAVAVQQGFEVTGTLGVLALAARHGLIDLAEAFDRLKKTSFRYRPELLDALLAQERPAGDRPGNDD